MKFAYGSSFRQLSIFFAVVKGRRLVKRQVSRSEQAAVRRINRTCSSMVTDGQLKWPAADDCTPDEWIAQCRFKDHYCVYFVKCNYFEKPRLHWNCTQVHDRNAVPICCDIACPSEW